MTRERLIEILEDTGYAINANNHHDMITAYGSDRAQISAMPTDKTITGWVFRVGKNSLSNIYDAIIFSKERIID